MGLEEAKVEAPDGESMEAYVERAAEADEAGVRALERLVTASCGRALAAGASARISGGRASASSLAEGSDANSCLWRRNDGQGVLRTASPCGEHETPGPSWELLFTDRQFVEVVHLFPPKDDLDALAHFALQLFADEEDDAPVWQTEVVAAASSFRLPVNAVGRCLRVQSLQRKPLALEEVRVFGQDEWYPSLALAESIERTTNLSVCRPCRQSSTAFGAVAVLAASGAVDPRPWTAELHSMSHTAEEVPEPAPGPWWLVDLGTACSVSAVRIYNRVDAHRERLRDFWLLLLPNDEFQNSKLLEEGQPLFAAAAPLAVDMLHVQAVCDVHHLRFAGDTAVRFVMLQSMVMEPLHLLEVEVLGAAVGAHRASRPHPLEAALAAAKAREPTCARFDPLWTCSSLLLEDGGAVVDSATYSTYRYAIVSPAASAGVSRWSMRVEDIGGPSAVAIGATYCPPGKATARHTGDMFVVSGDDGVVWARGQATGKRLSTLGIGAVVTVTYDADSGRLVFSCSGNSVVLDGIHGSLSPVVCTWQPGQRVRLLSYSVAGRLLRLPAAAEQSAAWSLSCTSGGVRIFPDAPAYVASRRREHSYAYCPMSFSDGQVTWACRIHQDTTGDEAICIGFTTLPVDAAAYNKSAAMYMLRCYNGQLYHGGSVGRKLEAIKPGSLVESRADFTAGTIMYQINGTGWKPAFSDIGKVVLHPAVAFYFDNRAVEMLSLQHNGVELVPAGTGVTAWRERTGRCFHPTLAHSSTFFGPRYLQVQSENVGYALVNAPITEGRAVWEFHVDSSRDALLMGVSQLPLTKTTYNSPGNRMWLLRLCNGELWADGAATGMQTGAVPDSATLRCELDRSNGSLHFFVDGVPLSSAFEGLDRLRASSGETLYPCVVFCARGGTASLTQVVVGEDARLWSAAGVPSPDSLLAPPEPASPLLPLDDSVWSPLLSCKSISVEGDGGRHAGGGCGVAIGDVAFTTGVARWQVSVAGPAMLGIGALSMPLGFVGKVAVGDMSSAPPAAWLYHRDGVLTRYGVPMPTALPPLAHGDVVAVTVDLNAGTLSLAVNEIDFGRAFSGLRGPVLPAVTLETEGAEATLLAVAADGDALAGTLRGEALPSRSPAPLHAFWAEMTAGDGVVAGTLAMAGADRSCAIADVGFSSGLAAWEFVLLRDLLGDEAVCVGAATLPIRNPAYDVSEDMWVVRLWNGHIYAAGQCLPGPTLPVVVLGSVLRFELDMTRKQMSMFIDGAFQGVLFRDIAAEVLYPAVAFYAPEREVALLRVEYSEPPVGFEHGSGRSPPLPLLEADALSLAPSVAADFGVAVEGAAFLPADSHGSVQFSDGNAVAASPPSLTHDRLHAVVNVGISAGRAVWEFLLQQDSRGDEAVCFGAVTKPVLDSAYDRSPSMYMLRAYNGNLYARGALLRAAWPVREGDRVRVMLDLTAGTLSYSINGGQPYLAFSHVVGELYPAVAFYSYGRAVRLVGVWIEPGKTRLTADSLAGSAGDGHGAAIVGELAGQADDAPLRSYTSRARFLEPFCSAGVVLLHDGRVARSRWEATREFAMLNVAVLSGKAVWDMLLLEDKLGDESCCFGAGLQPAWDARCEASPSLWMYRAYNGAASYAGRKALQRGPEVHPSMVVRVTYDADRRTLSYDIAGHQLKALFLNVSGDVLPACSFYNGDRSVCLLGFYATGKLRWFDADSAAATRGGVTPSPLITRASKLLQAGVLPQLLSVLLAAASSNSDGSAGKRKLVEATDEERHGEDGDAEEQTVSTRAMLGARGLAALWSDALAFEALTQASLLDVFGDGLLALMQRHAALPDELLTELVALAVPLVAEPCYGIPAVVRHELARVFEALSEGSRAEVLSSAGRFALTSFYDDLCTDSIAELDARIEQEKDGAAEA